MGVPGRRGNVKISYDKRADALYIRLLEGDHQCRVVRLTRDIALDFAEGKELMGIEVLGASRLLPNPEQPTIVLEGLLASTGRR